MKGGKSFEIWEGPCGGVGGQKFRDMGGAVLRYERCCFKIRKVLFRDMGGAVSRYGRCCFEMCEVLNLLLRVRDITFLQ